MALAKQVLNDMLQSRAAKIASARSILDKADKETKGILTAEQAEELRSLEKEADDIKTRVDAEVRLAEQEEGLSKRADASIAQAGGSSEEGKKAEKRMKAFSAFLARGTEALRNPEYRDQMANDFTEGGALVPPMEFIAQLIKATDDIVFVKQHATVHRLTRSVSLGAPTLDEDLDDAEWVSEATTAAADEMKFGGRELKPNPMSKLVKVTRKLLAASAIPVENLIRDRFAYKFGITEEKGYLTGDGASKALGVFVNSTQGIGASRDVSTGNLATDVTFDGLIEALGALKGPYQARARWAFHRNAVTRIRKLKDGQGQYLWQPSTQIGQPDTILGRPVDQSEYVPNTFTANQYVGIIADWSHYWIAEVESLEIQRLDELYAVENKVGFLGRKEVDGMPVLQEAFARVQLGS